MSALTANLTDMQAAFVRSIVQHGNASIAAKDAGYADSVVNGSKIRSLPHVQAAIAAELRRLLITQMAPAALQLLYKMMMDDKQEAKLRVACAKTLADRSGFIAPKARDPNTLDGKSVVDMSRSELVETSQRIAKELSDRAVTIIDSAPLKPGVDPDIIDILE